jgi:hypothetical protein
MLLERDETGDQQKATGMLGEATGMSTDLGMRSFTLMERVFQTRHPEGLNVTRLTLPSGQEWPYSTRANINLLPK